MIFQGKSRLDEDSCLSQYFLPCLSGTSLKAFPLLYFFFILYYALFKIELNATIVKLLQGLEIIRSTYGQLLQRLEIILTTYGIVNAHTYAT